MSKFKRILVPTDFGAASELALVYAADLAAGQASGIHLLHVIDTGKFSSTQSDVSSLESLRDRAKLIDEARARVRERASRHAAAGLTITIDIVAGRPAHVIIDQAIARGTDLIVMGTHGRTGVAHLVLGSVAERVVRLAPCPVLTVRDTSRVADNLAASLRSELTEALL